MKKLIKHKNKLPKTWNNKKSLKREKMKATIIIKIITNIKQMNYINRNKTIWSSKTKEPTNLIIVIIKAIFLTIITVLTLFIITISRKVTNQRFSKSDRWVMMMKTIILRTMIVITIREDSKEKDGHLLHFILKTQISFKYSMVFSSIANPKMPNNSHLKYKISHKQPSWSKRISLKIL